MKHLFHALRAAATLVVALGSVSFGTPALGASGAASGAGDSVSRTLPATASWRANEDDALLFEMRLAQYRLGDGVRGYQTPAGVCLDLGDTILALDLAVRLDKQSRRATGWVFDEERNLTIDRESGEEQIGNIHKKVAPDDIFDTPEGWCVATKTLSRWLGVGVEPDVHNAVVFIRSDRKLPPQLAAERRARVPVSHITFDLATLPHAAPGWHGFKTPSVDVVASIGVTHAAAASTKIDARYEIYAAGEAGPVAYDARLSSDAHGVPQSLRLRAYRTEPQGMLLGPLHATQVAAGDVSGLTTPLVAGGSIGRGVMISNRPVERPVQFDKTEFRGELPHGWDAELYRNGQLLAFANDRADGRYEFLDVPLQYGTNRFEVVLYGPQGQVRREVKSLAVGLDSIPPRQTYYWAGIDQDGYDLINLGGAGIVQRGGWRGSLGIERGLSARTSVAAMLHSLVTPEGRRRSYVEASLRHAFGPALVEVSAAQARPGGTALRFQALGEVANTQFTLESILARGGFVSDRVLSDVTSLSALSIDHLFGKAGTVIPLHLEARYTTRALGGNSLDVGARTSTNLGRSLVTAELAMHQDRPLIGPPVRSRYDATLLANFRVGKVRLRGEAQYELAPQSQLRNATIIAEWYQGDAFSTGSEWRAELGYDNMNRRGRAALGYIHSFKHMAVNASGEVASDGSVAAGLSLSFSLGRNPGSGAMRVTSNKLATRGSILVRVYRDINRNGVRDPGEPLEKGVQIAGGHRPIDGETDKAGELIADGLEPFQPLLISVDDSSLPDPLVQPSGPGIVVTPRPGVPMVVELPLVQAGELDGTLVRAGGGTIQGVDLELVDVEGRVLKTTRSDFDGFFLFDGVPYGRYTLRVAKLSAQAAEIGEMLGVSILIDDKTPSAHAGNVSAVPQNPRVAVN